MSSREDSLRFFATLRMTKLRSYERSFANVYKEVATQQAPVMRMDIPQYLLMQCVQGVASGGQFYACGQEVVRFFFRREENSLNFWACNPLHNLEVTQKKCLNRI